MLREQVRRFVAEEIIPVADAWERDGRVPRAIFRRLGELGLLGMRHPVEHGGTDMGPVASVTLPLLDALHSYSITRLCLAGPRARFSRTASG